MVWMAREGSGLWEEGREEEHDRAMVQQAQEKNKAVQHMLPNIQAEGIGEVDKGMGDLKSTVPNLVGEDIYTALSPLYLHYLLLFIHFTIASSYI